MAHYSDIAGGAIPGQMFTILIIEDDEDDIFLLQTALNREDIKNPVQVVRNGQQAICYLQGEGEYADRTKFPFPHVIFTDLKMPLMDGFEVLEWLKVHPKLFLLPTMVLSSSADEQDVHKSYRLGANAYLVKPQSLTQLQKLVRTARDFWTNCEKPTVNL